MHATTFKGQRVAVPGRRAHVAGADLGHPSPAPEFPPQPVCAPAVPAGLLRSVSRGKALVLPSNHAMQTRFMRLGLYGYRRTIPRHAINAFRQYVASGVAVRKVSKADAVHACLGVLRRQINALCVAALARARLSSAAWQRRQVPNPRPGCCQPA